MTGILPARNKSNLKSEIRIIQTSLRDSFLCLYIVPGDEVLGYSHKVPDGAILRANY